MFKTYSSSEQSCHNFLLVHDKPPEGASICETGLLDHHICIYMGQVVNPGHQVPWGRLVAKFETLVVVVSFSSKFYFQQNTTMEQYQKHL